MKILVLRVVNSSRHRKCFVRGYMHSFFVSKAVTRSYLARSGFWHKQLVHITPTPHFLWRKLYLSHFQFTLKTKMLEKWSLLLDLWIRFIFFLIYWFFTGYRRWPWLTNCWTEDKKIGEYCPLQYKNWPMVIVFPSNYGCTRKVAKLETRL